MVSSKVAPSVGTSYYQSLPESDAPKISPRSLAKDQRHDSEGETGSTSSSGSGDSTPKTPHSDPGSSGSSPASSPEPNSNSSTRGSASPLSARITGSSVPTVPTELRGSNGDKPLTPAWRRIERTAMGARQNSESQSSVGSSAGSRLGSTGSSTLPTPRTSSSSLASATASAAVSSASAAASAAATPILGREPTSPPTLRSPLAQSTSSAMAAEPSAARGSNSEERPSTPTWRRVDSSAFVSVKRESGGSYLEGNRQPAPPKAFKLMPVPPEEMEKIRLILANHPEFTKKYDIRIQKVQHEVLSKLFEAKIDALKLAADNEALLGSWEGKQEQEIRKSVDAAVKKMSVPTRHSNVYQLTAFHATKPKFLDKVLSSGLQCLAKTDAGYFGQGIYSTTYPVYAADIYGGRAGGMLLVCQAVFRRLFPVSTCDNFMGKPIQPGFDGHVVHVVPKTSNPNETMFVARGPFQKAQYDEIVMCDPTHYLTQYVIEYTPTQWYTQQISVKPKRKELRELILKYMDQNPLSDAYAALNQKLDEFSSNGAADDLLTIDASDFPLYTLLQRTLGEKEVKIQQQLGCKIQQTLLEVDSNDDLASQLPASFFNEQQEQEAQDENLKGGDTFFGKNQYQKAISEYQKVLKRLPQSFRANFGCGSAYYRLEKWDEAILHFKTALRFQPNDDKGRQDLETATQNYVAALIKRAKESVKQSRFVDSARDLREVLQHDSVNLEALGLFASIQFNIDKLDQAYRTAGRALAKNSNCAPALRVRGAVFALKGEAHFAQAMKDLSDSIRMMPSTFALIQRARLHLTMDHLKEAEEDCNAVLQKDAKNFAALSVRAKIFLKIKDLKRAEQDIRECKRQEPNDFAVLGLLGELHMQKNELGEATEAFRISFENYQKLRETEQRDQVKLLKQRDHMDFYEILLARAENFHRLNLAANALENYQEAIRLFPNHPLAYERRGYFYQVRGDTVKAQVDYAKVGELKKSAPAQQNATS